MKKEQGGHSERKEEREGNPQKQKLSRNHICLDANNPHSHRMKRPGSLAPKSLLVQRYERSSKSTVYILVDGQFDADRADEERDCHCASALFCCIFGQVINAGVSTPFVQWFRNGRSPRIVCRYV